MQYASIEEIRIHLRLEPEDITPDLFTILTQYSNAALEHISHLVNGELVEYPSDIPGEDDPDYKPNKTYMVFNYTMKQCQLMIVEEFFKHRGNADKTLSRPVSITIENMLLKQRKFNV